MERNLCIPSKRRCTVAKCFSMALVPFTLSVFVVLTGLFSCWCVCVCVCVCVCLLYFMHGYINIHVCVHCERERERDREMP